MSIPPPSDKVASWPLIGLFIGAVILALAYELVLFWMDQNVAEEGPEAAVEE